jgi:hypothetical protein
LNGFCPHPNYGSPFTTTVQEYLDKSCTAYNGSALEDFYSTFTPRTMAESLNLKTPSNPMLYAMPATASVPPWFPRSPDHQTHYLSFLTESENREHRTRVNAAHGCSEFGPVSEEKGALEFARLTRVARCIRENSFHIDRHGTNNISAKVFPNGNDYCFFIIRGHHRIAALAGLGYNKAVVQVHPAEVVRRNDAQWWPLVQQGWFNRQEAITIFDRIFIGQKYEANRTHLSHGLDALPG